MSTIRNGSVTLQFITLLLIEGVASVGVTLVPEGAEDVLSLIEALQIGGLLEVVRGREGSRTSLRVGVCVGVVSPLIH